MSSNPAALLLAAREEGSQVKAFILKSRDQTASHFLRCLVPCRDKSTVLDKDDVVQVKEAFKWVMQGLLARELGGVAVVAKVTRHRLTRMLWKFRHIFTPCSSFRRVCLRCVWSSSTQRRRATATSCESGPVHQHFLFHQHL